jgi:hypothetical protein
MEASVCHFMGGPQFYYPAGKLSPFAHVLFGAGQLSENTRTSLVQFSSTAFADAFGEGLDYRIGSDGDCRPISCRTAFSIAKGRTISASQPAYCCTSRPAVSARIPCT